MKKTFSVDAISELPETATSLGGKLDEKDGIILTVPWGVEFHYCIGL